MDSLNLTQLGVSGVVVVLLVIGIKVLWDDNKELRAQSRADQQTMLPALAQASAAIEASQQLSQQLIDRLTRMAIPPHDDSG